MFFLKALRQQKQRLEAKVTREQLLLGQLPALSLQILESVKSRGQATISELVVFTQANRNTVKKHLKNLVQARLLTKHGIGKGTYYTFINTQTDQKQEITQLT